MKDQNYVRVVAERVNSLYGEPDSTGFLTSVAADPMATLIKTVLSQATNDINSGKAYDNMMKAYPGWAELAEADEKHVASLIKIGGLGPQKAARIKRILRAVAERDGRYDLAFIEDLSDKEAWDYLLTLDGVGPKTAACTLLFSFGRPIFPVDTHIHRISRRLGIVGPKTSAVQTQKIMQELVAPELIGAFHINLINLGREICDARKPKCDICPLNDLCDHFRQTVAQNAV